MQGNLKRIAYKIEFQPTLFEASGNRKVCLYPPLLQDAWVKAVKNDFAPDGAFRYYQLLEDFKNIFQDSLREFGGALRHITDFSDYYKDEPDGIAQFLYQKMPRLAGNPAMKLLASDACHRFIELYMYRRMHVGLFLRLLTDAASPNALVLSRIKSGKLWNIVRLSTHSYYVRQAIKFWTYEGSGVIEKSAALVVNQEFGTQGISRSALPHSRRVFRKSLLTTGVPVFVNQFSRA